MRFLPALLSAIAIPSVISTSIAARDYATLHAFCQASGPNVFFAARYAEGPPRGIEFGECLAVQDPVRGPVLDGVLCKTGSCYASGNNVCSGALLPVPLPLLAGTYIPLVNVWVELVFGSSGTCYPNGLTN